MGCCKLCSRFQGHYEVCEFEDGVVPRTYACAGGDSCGPYCDRFHNNCVDFMLDICLSFPDKES